MADSNITLTAQRLKLLMLFRVLLVTLILGSAYILNINDVESFVDPSYIAMLALIVATYVLTLTYVLLYKYDLDPNVHAYVQFAGDSLLVGGLIYLTGGVESIFIFMFFLAIISAGMILGRQGAMVTATLCSVVFVVMLLVETKALGSFGPQEPVYDSRTSPIYTAVVHIGAFFLVGYLSGYLAEKIGEVGTELQRQQLDIKELKVLNRNILSSLISGLLTVDLSNRILFMNPAAASILGMSLSSAFGHPLHELLPKIHVPIDNPRMRLAREAVRWEESYRHPDGTSIYLGFTASPLLNAARDQIGHIISFQDLTRLKEMERQLRGHERLASIGQLAANIAHEIRNPLASISASIQMLASVERTDESEAKLMTIVLREIERLNQLITEFLDYARPVRRTFTTIDLLQSVRDTLLLFENDKQMTNQIEIVTEFPQEGKMMVVGDAEGLKQVLWNLLGNAVEAMPGGGRLTISAEEVKTGSKPMVVLTVKDTGIGMSQDVIAQVFEPFFTTKDRGTGLGLATAYRIVDEHGGAIRVRSTPHKGTEFDIWLSLLTKTDTSRDVEDQEEDAVNLAYVTGEA